MTTGVVRRGRAVFSILLVVAVLVSAAAVRAAPFASFVIDARTGEVLHAENADTRLHPASLTKMMTLYLAFEAVERGEITLDTMVTISRHAAAEPPSKLGLRAGQKIALRHLIRAAAIKSANDAATAIGEAIEGSEAAFARRMNRTARAMGMTRTNFKNAHGLTESGHLSTARDMAALGRHVFYDYPEYYNLFSRRTADARIAQVRNTNRRFLNAYEGADGIKTGYTSAAGFNLVASARRGQERIIGVVFGGKSTVWRNDKMAELLDLGFRKAPSRAAVHKPARPPYQPGGGAVARASGAVMTSLRPQPRPDGPAAPQPVAVALNDAIAAAVAEAQGAAAGDPPERVEVVLATAAAPRPEPRPETAVEIAAADPPPAPEVVRPGVAAGDGPIFLPQSDPQPETLKLAGAIESLAPAGGRPATAPPTATTAPPSRPAAIVLAAVEPAAMAGSDAPREVVSRVSTSGGRHFGIHLGREDTRDAAERKLLRAALAEIDMLSEALRKVVRRDTGFDANFVGMTETGAQRACDRLAARGAPCKVITP